MNDERFQFYATIRHQSINIINIIYLTYFFRVKNFINGPLKKQRLSSF